MNSKDWVSFGVMILLSGCLPGSGTTLFGGTPFSASSETRPETNLTLNRIFTQTSTFGISTTSTPPISSDSTPSPSPTNLSLLSASAVSVAGGFNHTCVITSLGGVKCWGSNEHGQLGNGSNIDSSTPVDVVGLESGVVAIAAGLAHSCALTTEGGMKCWGANESGELGNGATVDGNIPSDVIGLLGGATAIAAGGNHTCAVAVGGGVKCWGQNNKGQLGDGSTADSDTPVNVQGIADPLRSLAAGSEHTCGVTARGSVLCWGNDDLGQLGDGRGIQSRGIPADVVGLQEGVSSLSSSGDHTCALLTNGGVKCWGFNKYRQLGDGTTANRSVPVDLLQLGSGVVAVTAGASHTCALIDGTVKCWGWNYYGQLGDGTKTMQGNPVTVGDIPSDIHAIGAGGNNTCAVTGRGGVLCWGRNSNGQLGDGTTFDSGVPVDVSRLKDPLRMTVLRTVDGNGPVAFSPDGKTLLVPGNSGFIKMFDTSTWSELPVQFQQEGAVSGLEILPDGKSLICSTYVQDGNNFQIQHWDMATGKELFSIRGGAPIAVSPDGKLLAYNYFTEVRLADITSGMDLRTLQAQELDAQFLEFSPDGKTLITGDWFDYSIRLWDVATGRQIQQKKSIRPNISGMNLSPNGKILAFAYKQSLEVWDFESETLLQTINLNNTYLIGVVFSPDGKWLVSVSSDGTIVFWDTVHWTALYTLQAHTEVYGATFSPDGMLLVIRGKDGIAVWSATP